MNQEELKQRLVELAEEWDKQDEIDHLFDFFIANGVTIRERGATDTNVGGKWISVTERLPIKGTNVLIYSKSGGRAEGELCEDGWWQYRWCCKVEDVTHWMPLPEPPETEKGGE